MGKVYHVQGSLAHYGTPRHSGRYPWGSGKNPYQHEAWFLARSKELEKQGLSKTEIAKAFGMSSTKYRALYSIAVNNKRKEEIEKVRKLKAKQWSNVAIGKELGLPESTIRNYLKDDHLQRTTATEKLAEVLKKQIEEKPYLDVGKGVNRQLGVSDTQLKTAIEMLKAEGYNLYPFKIEQVTNPGKYTEMKVLTKGDVSYKDVRLNQDKITSPGGVYFEDYGETIRETRPPVSIKSDRVQICYNEQGGIDKDGLIELRKGVPDLSLGKNHYAQVRIAVDGTHYLKGMAVYSDNLPDGVDIRFNTNKHEGTPKMDVLKELKKDKTTGEIDYNNPFGAVVHPQQHYKDANGVEHQSAINVVNDDTDWDKWKNTLSSQFLSKQLPSVAKKQLNEAYVKKEKEFDEIASLTNPTVKRKLLESFSEDCDSAAVHLKAAAFPRQQTHVLLPLTTLKDNEVYAPNYETGEEVVLIRHPHAGRFEIPRLIVNNDNKEGKSMIGNAEHAIGVNTKTRQQMSGADNDGDTVLVIPTKGTNIQTMKMVDELVNFDPKESYPAYEGMPKVGKSSGFKKGLEMGKISNLITDMSAVGAPLDEIIRADKHSMVVIDAEKHNLDWRKSYRENRIKELQDIYQSKDDPAKDSGGASTLISRAKSEIRIPDRKEITNVNSMTPEEKERYWNGEKIYRDTGEKYEKFRKNENGEWVSEGLKDRTIKTTRMAATNDARTLSSGTLMEEVYAEHANKLKALANRARKELRMTGQLEMNPSAKKAFEGEVRSLKAKLNAAAKNSPLERQAQAIANVIIKAKIEANPDWEKDDIKKHRQMELTMARDRVGSQSRKKLNIEITDHEWKAIQSGAISDSMLSEILRYTDIASIQKRATPRTQRGLSASAKARARAMLNNPSKNYTWAQVADAVGVSVSTLRRELNGE